MLTRRKLLQILGIGGASTVVAPKIVSRILEEERISPVADGTLPIPHFDPPVLYGSGEHTSIYRLIGKGNIKLGDPVISNGDGTVSKWKSGGSDPIGKVMGIDDNLTDEPKWIVWL